MTLIGMALFEVDKATWRARLAITGAVVAPFAAFVAVLFLSGGSSANATAVGLDVSRARAAANPAAEPEEPGTTITVRQSDYGRILFDGRGGALYAFTRDPGGRSVCTDACAASWPPYLLRGSLRAGVGVEASLLGTTARPNGARQVTYAGRPLYYWVGDQEPGDVGCQNVVEFGGRWLVLRATGRLVREANR
jgi:predicted lipoprotein with Yx(FWY)xxD motif